MMKRILTPLFLSLMFVACADGADTGNEGSPATEAPYVVEVVARGLTLEAPDSIRSGWTTFRFMNESPLTHFVVFERLPDGRTLEDSKSDVFPVFQDAMDLINEGRVSEGFAQFERFPAWFQDVVFWGGPGFLGPFKTGVTTVRMDPGTYVLECYVKTAGRFHSVDGMAVQLVVTEEASGAPEPSGSITLALSADGIEVQGTPRPGLHIVKVEFAEQQLHEHSLGHDVHLVRLEGETDVSAAAAWMNWVNSDGLETPAPAEFLGGTHEMPAGEVAYFTVDLTPGSYAWVAEVPHPVEKGMFTTFTVD